MSESKPICPECGGTTLEFRFSGKDTQHRLCPRWKEPGHLSEAEVRLKLQQARDGINPSRRQA